MADFLYIIEARNGLVKIGCSSHPKTRLRQARLYSPVLVRLVAVWPAARRDEFALHARFDAQRDHGEWFRVEGPLVSFLEEVWCRGVDAIPKWADLTFHAENGKCRLNVERSRAAKARWSDPEWRERWHSGRQRHAAPAQPEAVA